MSVTEIMSALGSAKKIIVTSAIRFQSRFQYGNLNAMKAFELVHGKNNVVGVIDVKTGLVGQKLATDNLNHCVAVCAVVGKYHLLAHLETVNYLEESRRVMQRGFDEIMKLSKSDNNEFNVKYAFRTFDPKDNSNANWMARDNLENIKKMLNEMCHRAGVTLKEEEVSILINKFVIFDGKKLETDFKISYEKYKELIKNEEIGKLK